MTSVISLFADELNEQLIEELRQRYGNARLEIKISDSDDETTLTEEEFWRLIALLDWDASDSEGTLLPLIKALEHRNIPAIYQFEATLSKLLYDLDTRAHGIIYAPPPEFLSVDGFLYGRAAVIANGKDFYQSVLGNPKSMLTDIEFEPLLYVAHKAFTAKTGEEMNYFPLYSYETYSNQQGWSDLKLEE